MKFLSDGFTFPCILKEELTTASEEGKGQVGILFGAVAIGKGKGQLGELGKDCPAARDWTQVRNQSWPALEQEATARFQVRNRQGTCGRSPGPRETRPLRRVRLSSESLCSPHLCLCPYRDGGRWIKEPRRNSRGQVRVWSCPTAEGRLSRWITRWHFRGGETPLMRFK